MFSLIYWKATTIFEVDSHKLKVIDVPTNLNERVVILLEIRGNKVWEWDQQKTVVINNYLKLTRLGASLRYLADTPYPLNLQSPHLKPKPHENNSKFLAVSVLATDFSVLQTVLPGLTNFSCILPFLSSCCSLHLAGRVNFSLESAPLPLFSADDFPFLQAFFFNSALESFLFFLLDTMFPHVKSTVHVLSTESSPHLATPWQILTQGDIEE